MLIDKVREMPVEPFIFIIIAVVIVTFLKGMKNKGKGKKKEPFDMNNYALVNSILTPAEMAFFRELAAVTRSGYRIMVKVRVADIIQVKKGTGSYMAHFGKIKSKHVDYLLCDLYTLKPLLAIELDDKSHQRSERISRDAFVNELFKSVSLPVMHYPVKKTYNQSEIHDCISNALDGE